MKKYIVRSLKYFFALCVLCIALMGLMLMTGTSALSLDDTLYVMLHTDRYLMLFAAIVALAAVYPRFGFVVRRVEGDIEENREQILNAFRSAGFSVGSVAFGPVGCRPYTVLCGHLYGCICQFFYTDRLSDKFNSTGYRQL